MAQDFQTFDITVPAGTAKATPQTTSIELGVRNVVKVLVVVPPGPRGEVGFYLGTSNVQVIPKNVGAWIVTDDHKLDLDIEDMWESGSWQLVAYNTGHYDHTLHVTFESNFVIGAGGVQTTAPIQSALLQNP